MRPPARTGPRALLWVALCGALLCLLLPGVTLAGKTPRGSVRGCPPRCPHVTEGGPQGPVEPATRQSARMTRLVASSRSTGRIPATRSDFQPQTSARAARSSLASYRSLSRAASSSGGSTRGATLNARALRSRSPSGASDLEPPSQETRQSWARSAHTSGRGLGANEGGEEVSEKGSSTSGYENLSALLDKASGGYDVKGSLGLVESKGSLSRAASAAPAPEGVQASARAPNLPAGPGYARADEIPLGGKTRTVPVAGTSGPAGPTGGFTAESRPAAAARAPRDPIVALGLKSLELSQDLRRARRDAHQTESLMVREMIQRRDVAPLEVKLKAVEADIARLRAERRQMSEPVDMDIEE